MTVDRNRNVADKVMVVGNDNCHLSRKYWKKQIQNTLISSNRRQEIRLQPLRLPLCRCPDDILIITPSDHIIDDMEAYETAIEEAVEKALKDTLLLWDCAH
jgi:mannose-1-phosphate guanylyltransferase